MISLFDVLYDVKTAGPGSRTEVFFAGCSKAESGNPCEHCFNPKLWHKECGRKVTCRELVDEILRKTEEPYFTFCGGEPTDQITDLVTVCRMIKDKRRDAHILVYTYHEYNKLKDNSEFLDLLPYIDILVDGSYDGQYRIYNNKSDNWVRRSIGSYNQRVYKIDRHVVEQYNIDKNGELHFKDKWVM